MPHSVAVLQELPLLSNLPQVTVAHLAQHATERAFAKREVVLQKGSSPTALCFLLEGRLQGLDFTMDDREVGLYFVNPGDYFGEVALLDGQPQPEYVTAVSRSRALFIPQDLVKPILYASPKVAETLCTRLSSRLREVSEHRRILGLSNPVQRVCAQLQLLCRDATLAGIHVPNVPTHQELAMMINASRETVTRAFQQLFAQRVLVRDGDSLHIMNLPYIEDIAQGRIAAPKA